MEKRRKVDRGHKRRKEARKERSKAGRKEARRN